MSLEEILSIKSRVIPNPPFVTINTPLLHPKHDDVTISALPSPRRRLGMYEGWDFNSGNYLFTTDTK